MAHAETGGIGEVDILALDEHAFERGRQFLDGILGKLHEFDGYPGIATPGPNYPRAEEIQVPFGPNLHQRMFFSFAGATAVSYLEGMTRDGHKEERREDELVWELGLTEARRGEIRYKPDLRSEEAIIYGIFGEPNLDSIYEHDLVRVRRNYLVRELGRLDIAVVSKEVFPN